MVTYHFYRNNTMLGWLIRKVSDGRYDHVAIGINGKLYEAQPRGGVTVRNCDFDFSSNYAQFFDLNEARVEKFLKAQVGKKYDYVGCMSFAWRFFSPRIGKWYCSELAMASLMKGYKVSSEDYDQKQSPQSFFALCKLIIKIA